MLSRRTILGSVAVLAAGLITGVAAFAQGGGPGFRHGMMQHQTRKAHMAEALALFEADTIDPGRVAAFRAQRQAEHAQVADAITQSLTEVHDVLTPVQRKAVADWIRNHRGGHGG